MINVYVLDDEYPFQLIMSGHAGYAESGHDIVCAAVSILTYTLSNLAHELHGAGIIDGCMVQDTGQMLHISLFPCTDPAVRIIIDSFLFSISQLQEQYPEFVGYHILLSE